MEMDYFEVPNGIPVVKPLSYLVALLVVMVVSFITYLTCRKELFKKPAEALRNEVPNVKVSSLNLSTKGMFKKLNFSSKWNLRDILRNKFRTLTAVVGIVGCCMLIVCAFGMLNSMNHFIKLQFEDLYNFNYKLSLKENIIIPLLLREFLISSVEYIFYNMPVKTFLRSAFCCYLSVIHNNDVIRYSYGI